MSDARPFALVTGASRGIGAAIARALAARGCRVAVHCNNRRDLAEGVRKGLPGDGHQVIAANLSTEDGVDRAWGEALSSFGRIDILVNNAGVGYLMAPFTEMPLERWDLVLGVNLTGAFLCSKYAAQAMIEQGRGGRIINIASVAAKSGSMYLSAYAASKHGMIGFTRSAALELGRHKITVNAICPNHVTTGLGSVQNALRAEQRGQTIEEYLAEMRSRIPLGRVGLAEDTAKACAFLCSSEADYITAEAMNVSGGQEMH